MVIMTAKVPKRRILLVVLLLLAAAVVLALCLGGAKHGGEKPQRTDAKGSTEPKVQISVILTVGQISLKISWKFFIPTNFPAEEPVKPVKALNSTVTRE